MEVIESNAPAAEPAAAAPLKVGDRVRYVPHEAHARQPNKHGGPHGEANDFPWVVGRRKPVIERGQKVGETVEEITGEGLRRLMEEVARDRAAMADVVFVRPKSTWPAVVVAVNDDGTVDLDVASNQAGIRHGDDGSQEYGIALRYRGVKVADLSKNLHHTCHKPVA